MRGDELEMMNTKESFEEFCQKREQRNREFVQIVSKGRCTNGA